ncbi:rhodanese-like domain-containing protein [Actinophytocola gossypii]|uniref:rhodanese-like domain-containing protein n=1 Tax=Actinophytocola gossypii TaxID=2812003 RepID=UPI0021A7E156|nr:rhodanese-like domain-containing protein [Actinophytocola gossypii]
MTDRISGLLAAARAVITRHEPAAAAEVLRRGGLLVDLRPTEFRWRFGEVPGAIAVSRHVLEWRLDVTSEHRLDELGYGEADREIVLMCNEGYTSSLAAHQVMTQLGLTNVADVIGGYTAWRDAGLPTVTRLAR